MLPVAKRAMYMSKPMGRILLVDDEPDVLEVCERVLSRAGYEVRAARDAKRARGYLAEERFDLAILDIHMPNESGISLLEHAHKVDPALPAILITGYPAVSAVLDSVRLNVHEFLVKPFTLRKLLEVVATGITTRDEWG
jgi:DNA-binding NtrC family response regulator